MHWSAQKHFYINFMVVWVTCSKHYSEECQSVFRPVASKRGLKPVYQIWFLKLHYILINKQPLLKPLYKFDFIASVSHFKSPTLWKEPCVCVCVCECANVHYMTLNCCHLSNIVSGAVDKALDSWSIFLFAWT